MTTTQEMIHETNKMSYRLMRLNEGLDPDAPSIAVDSREPPDVLAQVQTWHKGAYSTLLDSGDCRITLPSSDVILVERKTADDLCASIADGRLFEQASRLPNEARFAWLVIHSKPLQYSKEGRLWALRSNGYIESGWRQASIDGALMRVQLSGVMIHQSETYTAALAQIMQVCMGADSAHASRVRTTNPFDTYTQRKLDFLAALPGVGTERAAKLLAWRPQAKLHELLALVCRFDRKDHAADWGPKTISRIREFLELSDNQTFYTKEDAQDEIHPT